MSAWCFFPETTSNCVAMRRRRGDHTEVPAHPKIGANPIHIGSPREEDCQDQQDDPRQQARKGKLKAKHRRQQARATR
jgi:hypothetical protein